ncbi:fimbrial chaperone [Mesorhizobium sp. L-8-10]|uniref:fimbrial biogenesis chaperone n=1 Tax=Mesorhizobium sp. L-8-10 TaxID=2744523 RepID=UPI0019291FFD|nr:molecular chaperone [Mesorhizobium sp. L-8-10]BCH28966.1 fimbrial chaperone [Mesorhizobium sp. L-8-10]
MIRSFARAVAGLAVTLLAVSAHAASLRVAPVMLDIKAPTATSSIRVWNDSKRPLNVQIRIFRWTQRDGQDVYEAADTVAVSPPMTTLRPGGENLVRVVRTSKRQVQAEESYRLIVDELPDARRRKDGTVALVVRHSIPVFFTPAGADGADASWTVERKKGGYVVTVRNDGATRLRVSNLMLGNRGGPSARRDGLVGYVLGNSTVRWFVPGGGRSAGSALKVSAESESGRFDATARLRGG